GAAAGAAARVVAQNGVEHAERVAPFAGAAPVVPLLAYTPAERRGPGLAVLTRPGGREAVVPDDAPSREVAGLLGPGGLAVETAADFRSAAWRKLVLNTASMTATTLTDRPMDVLREPAVAAFAERLLAEVVAAGRSAGARLADDLPRESVAWLQSMPDGTTTSMLQDRRAGRPLEHEAVQGAALRAADRAGLPAPLLRSVTALLSALRP
ncbi:ketopantoate reductase family protein, partial [Amnibacterium endophyticum]